MIVAAAPSRDTIHFTFGSYSMMVFLRNWLHFVRKVGLDKHALVGAADAQMLTGCTEEGIPSAGLRPELNVWNYTVSKEQADTKVQQGSTEWKYYRHHKSSFLEIGLVKVAFLWELVNLGFDVLISDLDIVWIAPEWEPWMTYRKGPPLTEATLIALSDIIVSTDELDSSLDNVRGWTGGQRKSELNTGVLFMRATNGTRAFIQAWRMLMLEKKDVAYTNDQIVYNQMVDAAGMEPVAKSAARLSAWEASLIGHGLLTKESAARAWSAVSPVTRDVFVSTTSQAKPCLAHEECAPAVFSLGTLPMRVFTGGHGYFFQHTQDLPGDGVRDGPGGGHARPEVTPLTVHFTFQFGDTTEFPHGKRQRAREAGLWTADPPEYYTEGLFLRLTGPLYSAAQRVAVEAKFPEWSPQRHMHLDAIQRAAVRDLLALSIALNATLIMPKLHCFCDRYWGHLSNCRFPHGPSDMHLPFACPQDSLFDVQRWNKKEVRFRESGFLSHPSVPATIREQAVSVVVSESEPVPSPGTLESQHVSVVRPGTPMSGIVRGVLTANPAVRLVEISTVDIRKLCRHLGSRDANVAFNKLMRYVMTESARYCPQEDLHAELLVGKWDWQNPFTAFNCTWGFVAPTAYVEAEDAAVCTQRDAFIERSNSTTCPRQMLCNWNVDEAGTEWGTLINGSFPRCNAEGYNGLNYELYGNAAKDVLAALPGGRCPYPPGDRPGSGPGFDAYGHYVGGG